MIRRPPRSTLLSLHDALPIYLFPDDPDLVLEHDGKVAVDALARQVHEGQDVGRGPPAPVHDEVRVLGGDLGTVDPLALEARSEEHTSELQSQSNLVCRLLLEQ